MIIIVTNNKTRIITLYKCNRKTKSSEIPSYLHQIYWSNISCR